ncbi:MAG: hypothetical protein K5886_12570 [Lachnospiraceae bacterium]|nr:hypothetical protein [Lachnospiraceae bacterium]
MKKALSIVLMISLLMSASVMTVFADDKGDQAETQASAETQAETSEASKQDSETASTDKNAASGNEDPASADTNEKTGDEDSAQRSQQYGDDLVSTKHKAVIHGQTIEYTATCGKMTVENDAGACGIFFIAYTRDDAADPGKRPVTFAFNGGPGAASSYINFLCMGPKRMELDEVGHSPVLPAKLVDNEDSLLDMTDLVFIDAVGTGYSTAYDDENGFIGYYNDIRTIGDFIRLYVNRNKRWSSPKYIAGESYGTTRAVGLCQYLSESYSMGLNGLMLVSAVNDFSEVVFTPGNDLPFAMFLPTYAADARYHGRLDKKYQDMELEEFLGEVREFVSEEYYPALFKGRRLSEDKKDEIAGKIASYTGLSKEYVLESNLRVELADFCKTLLKDQKLMTGRYDGRFTGPVKSGSVYDGSSDPSTFDLDLPLRAAANQYYVEELGYIVDTPYIPLSMDINYRWTFDADNYFLTQESIISDCMTANSKLKVWVLCGYYDGATPFYGAEWVYDHVFIDDSRKDNLSFTYYPAGHMFYLDKESYSKFRKDAEEWYEK